MELPAEILLKIFESLPFSSLVTITLVSRVWRALSIKLLYTIIDYPSWKPKRVSTCLTTLASGHDTTISSTVRHLDLRLWSFDPEFSRLLVDALVQTTGVTKLKLTMSETFSRHFELHLLQRGIIACETVGEPQPELWTKQFLPNLQELELSVGYRPFQLAAGRPVWNLSSPTHMQYEALQHLIPFFQRSLGPVQSVHFNLTGSDTKVASTTLKYVSWKLPCLTHVFFNFFVSKRAYPPKFTPDLLEDLSSLSSLHSVELLLPRHARAADPFLYSHFAALHMLKATAVALTRVVIDTIRWQYCPPRFSYTENTYGWSPLPSDTRTHAWWLGQYGSATAARAAMVAMWKEEEQCIPPMEEIGMSLYRSSMDSMSIYDHEASTQS